MTRILAVMAILCLTATSSARLPGRTGSATPPVPAIDWTPPSFTIDPANAGPDDRSVTVRVRASKPVRCTIGFQIGLANGSAYAPVYFAANERQPIVFAAGETERLVTLPLLRALDPGRTIKVLMGGGGNSLNNIPIKGAEGLVTGSATTTQPVRPRARAVRRAPASMQRGRKLAFRSDFLGAIGPARSGGWRTTFAAGRYIGNGGSGLNVDEAEYPGLGSHPILTDDAGRRRRVLRVFGCSVEYQGKAYTRCLNTLSSDGLFAFRRGDYVTVRAKFDVADGVQFAIWALAAGGGWPPEIDFPETCLHMVAVKCRYSVNQHYLTASGKHVQYGYTSDIAPDGKWHDYALDWRRDGTLMFLLDGREIFREPSAIDVPMYLIIGSETEMGGSGGFAGEARGWLDHVEVWR